MSYVYTAKAPVIPVPPEPEDWPDWEFPDIDELPDDPDIAWPPGWPLSSNGYSIALTFPATVLDETNALIVVDTLLSGIDTDDLNNHLIGITAKKSDGSSIQLRKSASSSWRNTLWYKVSNYSGSKYGVSENIQLKLTMDPGTNFTVYSHMTSVDPELTDNAASSVGSAITYTSAGKSTGTATRSIKTSSADSSDSKSTGSASAEVDKAFEFRNAYTGSGYLSAWDATEYNNDAVFTVSYGVNVNPLWGQLYGGSNMTFVFEEFNGSTWDVLQSSTSQSYNFTQALALGIHLYRCRAYNLTGEVTMTKTISVVDP